MVNDGLRWRPKRRPIVDRWALAVRPRLLAHRWGFAVGRWMGRKDTIHVRRTGMRRSGGGGGLAICHSVTHGA